MPILCWFGFHVWGPWGLPFQGVIYAEQRNTCQRCGLIKQRVIGLDAGLTG